VGVNALPANDVGASNTASGYQALFFNSSGNSNTAEGVSAMFSNQSGNGNTAVGVGALEGNTSGSSNTALGVQALADGGGSNNTAVGANAGPDASHLNLSNTTAIGANAQVTASNSLVLGSINGVNGATADTLVGIGTTAPTAKLDVHGNANFTGPITFAAGQVFPGTGTITGVTPGTGLSGGGTGGNVPVSLNTSFTDGRYAQLTANNAFSGSQTVNNSVGIGTVPNPAFALQAIGTIRSETGGLSIGGNAPVQVDAPGIAGGRLTILSNGDVGINKPSPTATLDVAGVVNATALAIHGDTPMNAAPHMYFSGFFAGSIATGQEGAFIVPSKSILITRMTMMSGFSQIICSPPGTISIQKDNSPVTYLYSLSFGGPAASDSGPISVPVAGGTPIELIVSVGPVCGIYQGPNNVNVNVEYVMQ